MENSPKGTKGTSIFTRPFFFVTCFLLSLSLSLSGQNISKHYISSFQSNGTLYYIFKQKGFFAPDKQKIDYEIIYLTTSDSALINFSYRANTPRRLDSIGFVSGSHLIIGQLKKIFITTKRATWVYRYSTKVPYIELTTFFKANNSPKIKLFTKDGEIDFLVRRKKWRKNAEIVSKIFEVVSYNMSK